MNKLIFALALAVVRPASACEHEARPPQDMITDSPRGQRIAAALDKAQKERDAAFKKRDKEIEADPRYQEIDKRLKAIPWNGEREARDAVLKERDAFLDAELRAPLDRQFPVTVYHSTFLCGGARLPDGHTINAGSSWSIRNAGLPELKEVQFSGAEMHYILEHGQGRPERLELLEKLLELPAAPKVSGEKVGAAVSRLILADWR